MRLFYVPQVYGLTVVYTTDLQRDCFSVNSKCPSGMLTLTHSVQLVIEIVLKVYRQNCIKYERYAFNLKE